MQPPTLHLQSYSQPMHMPSTHSLPTPSPVNTVDHEVSPENHVPQISSQESSFESARNLVQEFGIMTPDFNSSPTTSTRSESTTTPLAPPTNNSLTPTSSDITSKVQAQPPPVTPEITDTTTSRNQTHFVMKQSNLPKDLFRTGAQTEDIVQNRSANRRYS